jgi:hypothetical protein
MNDSKRQFRMTAPPSPNGLAEVQPRREVLAAHRQQPRRRRRAQPAVVLLLLSGFRGLGERGGATGAPPPPAPPRPRASRAPRRERCCHSALLSTIIRRGSPHKAERGATE